MATTSKVADELFGLPKQYDSADPIAGPGARRQARQARQNQLTSQMGSAAANTKLAAEAADQANAAAAKIEGRLHEMVTEKGMLLSTLAQLTKPASHSPRATNTHPSPLAKAVLSDNGTVSHSDSHSARATALGEAREAEFYIDSSQKVKELGTKWGILIITLLGVLGLIYAWYHRFRIVPLLVMFVILGLAARYPVYTMAIPRAAISPFLKLV
jgi:hypothetical protein